MKVVLVGPHDVSGAEVGRVIDQFTDADELVTTGALRHVVDRLVRRNPRARRPKITVEFIEAGRYYDTDAAERLAFRLVYASVPPHAIVVVGELEGAFGVALLAAAGIAAEHNQRPMPVWSGEDFVRERTTA